VRELHELPGYTDKVDPSVEPLKDVFGTTLFPELVQCGLKNCRQWHLEGYVVELENGKVTNVGNICGRHFGTLFESRRIEYQERQLRPHLIEKLAAGRQVVARQTRHIDSQSQDLRELLARRVRFKRAFPRLSGSIEKRAHEGNTNITEDVERSASEIDDLVAANSSLSRDSVRYRTVRVGTLTGLSFFVADIGAMLQVLGRAEAFASIESLPLLQVDALLDWERWFDALPSQVVAAADLIGAGGAFFSEMNVRLIARIVTDAREQAQFSVRAVSNLASERSAETTAASQSASESRKGRRRGWGR
jgi:hypothetical protein